MRKAKWVLIPALGLVLTAGAAWSFGQAPDPDDQGGPPQGEMRGPEGMPGMRGRMPMSGGPSLREQLGLNDEQASKLRSLGLDAAKTGLRARSEMMIKRMELNELLEADEPNRAAIDQKIRELSDAQHAMLKSRIENRLAMHQVLTPEQRAKARTLLRQHMRQRMFHRRGMRGRGGRGFRPDRGFGPRSGFGPGDDFGPEFGPPPPGPPEN